MPTFSHSRLSTFENCKLQYKYKYVEKIKTDRGQTIETYMGSRVHDTLEQLYKNLRLSKLWTEEEALAFYHKEWEENWKDEINIVKKDFNAEHYRQTGEKCVRDYYKRFHPFNQNKVLATELQVHIPLDATGDIKLVGYIDRLDKAGEGIYEIHDYKTSGNLPSQEKADQDRQLALYAMAVKREFPDAKEVRLIWHYLIFDTERISSRTEEELKELKSNTLSLVHTAMATKEFPAHTSALCNYCDYQPVCPEWKHKFASEALPENKYKDEPGVKLVDTYTRLKYEIKEREEELEEVKAALFDFSSKEGMDTIYGSDMRAKIWKKDVVKLPSHDDPRQEDLISTLKILGRFPEVVRLDSWELAKIIDEGRWPPEIINQLIPYTHREEVKRIYLSQKK